MDLGLSLSTLDRAPYDRSFHTLTLEQLCYLHHLDHEAELTFCATKVADLQYELEATNVKIHELEVATQDLNDSQAVAMDFL